MYNRAIDVFSPSLYDIIRLLHQYFPRLPFRPNHEFRNMHLLDYLEIKAWTAYMFLEEG